MSEQSRGGTGRFERIFQKYILVTSGWAGLLAGYAWMFSLIDEGIAFLFLMFASAMAGLHGHHGLEMGWFDRSVDSATEHQEGEQ